MESLFGELAFALFIAAHMLAILVLRREPEDESPSLRKAMLASRPVVVILGASAP
jgi:hypothetical protein